MQTFSAQMTPWFASYGIIVCALYFLPGESSFRKVAFAAQTQAPSPQGAAGDHASPACPLPGSLPGPLPPAVDAPYCVYTIAAGDTLDRIATQYGTTPDTLLRANRKTRVRGKKPVTNRNVLPAGALLLIPTTSLSLAAPAEDPSFPHQTVTPESSLTPPVSEAPSVPSNAQAPVVSTEEKIVHERADPREGQTAIQADREQHARDIAAIKSGLEQLTKRITGLHNEFEKKQSDTSLAKTVALAVAGVCILAIIGAFQFGVSLSRPSQPTPSLETAGHGMLPQMAPPKTFLEESVSMDIRIATGYLSRRTFRTPLEPLDSILVTFLGLYGPKREQPINSMAYESGCGMCIKAQGRGCDHDC